MRHLLALIASIRRLAAYFFHRPAKQPIAPDSGPNNPDDQPQAPPLLPPPTEIAVHFEPTIEDEYRANQRAGSRRDVIKIVIEAATLVAVIIYAFITLHLFWTTQETVKETKRSNELTQRAYVMIPRVDLIRDKRRGKEEWGLRVAFENSGQSPATVTAWGVFPVTDRPPADAAHCPTYAVNRLIGMILGPKMERGIYTSSPGESIRLPNMLTVDEVIPIALSQRPDKRMPLTLYTIVEYVDVFTKDKPSKRRHTRTCHSMLPYVDGSNVEQQYIFRDKFPPRGAFGDCDYCNSWD